MEPLEPKTKEITVFECDDDFCGDCEFPILPSPFADDLPESPINLRASLPTASSNKSTNNGFVRSSTILVPLLSLNKRPRSLGMHRSLTETFDKSSSQETNNTRSASFVVTSKLPSDSNASQNQPTNQQIVITVNVPGVGKREVSCDSKHSIGDIVKKLSTTSNIQFKNCTVISNTGEELALTTNIKNIDGREIVIHPYLSKSKIIYNSKVLDVKDHIYVNNTEELKGYIYKKFGTAFKLCWLELEDMTEIVSIYSSNPKSYSSLTKNKFLGSINLENCVMKEKVRGVKHIIRIVEASGKTHSLCCKPEDFRVWVDRLEKIRDNKKFNPTEGGKEDVDDEQEKAVAPDDDSLWNSIVEDYNGKDICIKDIVGEKTTLLIFLRHFGCLICRQLTGRLLQKRKELEDLGIQIIAIGMGAPKIAQLFAKEFNFPGSIFVDQKRDIYRKMGCKYGLTYIANPLSANASILANKEGYSQQLIGEYGGGRAVHRQIGGHFVVNKKHGIVFRHVERYLGDLCNLDNMLKVITRFCEENPEDNWTSENIIRTWAEFDAGDETGSMISRKDKSYHLELGTATYSPNLRIIDNISYYKNIFQDKEHTNFVASHPVIGPIVISIENCEGDRRALVCTKKGYLRRFIPVYEYEKTSDALKYVRSKIPFIREDMTFTKVEDKALVKELVSVEARLLFSKYKFGVLLASPGKCTELECLQNTSQSEDFYEFMDTIATRITLKGWDKYAGGLQTGDDSTGTESYYTNFEDKEIMFHVAPLLPLVQNDPSRKRHIGNDVVVIIFKEGIEDTFDPTEIDSHFNHIFVVVQKISKNPTRYRIHVCTKPTVPPFLPYLPPTPEFKKGPQFRNYFLTKLINGEKSCISLASTFSEKMVRTRDALLQKATEQYIKT